MEVKARGHKGETSSRGRQSFGGGRRFFVGANVIIMISVALVLSLALVYLGFRPETRVRWDLTEDQALALSDKSKDILKSLRTDVEILSLFHPTQMDQNVYIPGFNRVIESLAYRTNDLLEEYRIHSSGKISIEVLLRNSSRDAERWKEVINLYQAQLNTVLVICNGRRKALTLDDLGEIDRGNYNQENPRPARVVQFTAEQALTSTILELSEMQAPVAYFLEGHGERSLEDANHSDSLAMFTSFLANDNFVIRKLSIEGQGSRVPDDCDVLAVIAPEREIPQTSIDAIVEYLKGGGRLFLAVEPTSSLANYSGDILLRYGIIVRKIVVCYDATSGGFVNANPTTLFIDKYGDAKPVSYHRDRKLQTIFAGAAALDTVKVMPSGVKTKPLLWTEREAWGDPVQTSSGTRQRDPDEPQAQFILGMQSTGGESAPGSRLIVFSDADFLSNAGVSQGPGNLDLGLNCFQWLVGREQLISISPKIFKDRQVDLTLDEFESIFYYTVVWMPLASVVLGLAVWWRRRH